MSHAEFLLSERIGKITYFYDQRSEKKSEIEDFLASENLKNIENSLSEDIYLSL